MNVAASSRRRVAGLPPAGEESNWIPTGPGRRFELMFRLYAPTKALFDKAWTLPDVEKVAGP